MDNLYFSKNKPTQPRTPTNTLFQNDSGTVGSSFDERIDLLEEQLNQLALNHNHSVIQINQIVRMPLSRSMRSMKSGWKASVRTIGHLKDLFAQSNKNSSIHSKPIKKKFLR